MMLFIPNKLGGYHGHADALAVNLWAYGRSLLRDTGTATYNTGSESTEWQRNSTISHNTIQINNEGSPVPNRAGETELISNDGFDLYTGMSDAYTGFEHERSILFAKDAQYAIVSDAIRVEDSEAVNTYKQAWHTELLANTSIDSYSKIAATNYDDGGTNLKIVPVDPEKITASTQQGWINQNESKFTVYEKSESGNVYFDTLLMPIPSGVNMDIEAQRISLDTPVDVATAFEFDVSSLNGKVMFYLSREDEYSPRNIENLNFNGRMFNIQKGYNDDLKVIMMIGGTELKQNDKTIVKSEQELSDLQITYKNTLLEIQGTVDEDNEIRIYAPNVRTVRVNGDLVDHETDGDYIIISVDEQSGGSGGSGGGGGGTSKPSIPGGGTVVNPTPKPDTTDGEEDDNDNTESTPIPSQDVFEDVKGHWAEEEITQLYGKGIINGVSEKEFEPDRALTRAEAATLISNILKPDKHDASKVFTDVNENDWYFESVSIAAQSGIINGYEDGSFSPDRLISREELTVIFMRTYRYLSGDDDVLQTDLEFSDKDKISSWAVKDVCTAVDLGIIQGDDNNYFRPSGSATRAEASVMLYRILDLLDKAD